MKATFQAADPTPLESPRTQRARYHPRPRRIWSVSFLVVLSWVGVVIFVGGLGMLLSTKTTLYGWLALSGLASFVLLRAGSFILSQRLHCTLCHGTILHEKDCHKHSDAYRIPAFSYRDSAVVAIVTTASFRCMYCGTPYRLKK